MDELPLTGQLGRAVDRRERAARDYRRADKERLSAIREMTLYAIALADSLDDMQEILTFIHRRDRDVSSRFMDKVGVLCRDHNDFRHWRLSTLRLGFTQAENPIMHAWMQYSLRQLALARTFDQSVDVWRRAPPLYGTHTARFLAIVQCIELCGTIEQLQSIVREMIREEPDACRTQLQEFAQIRMMELSSNLHAQAAQ